MSQDNCILTTTIIDNQQSNSPLITLLPAETYQSTSTHMHIREYSNQSQHSKNSIKLTSSKLYLKKNSRIKANECLLQTTTTTTSIFPPQKAFSSVAVTGKHLDKIANVRSQFKSPNKTSKFNTAAEFMVNDDPYSLSEVSSLDLNDSIEYIYEGDNEEVFEI